MARIDTLANFLTDVATAIKNKTGKTDAITPANFDTEINSIEAGGGSGSGSKYAPRYISFYYYTGTELDYEIANLDTSNITSMKNMFNHCSNLASLEISNFNTSNVTNMNNMFYYCSALTTIALNNFDTSNATDMSAMFSNCTALTNVNIPKLDIKNVTTFRQMFTSCTSLKTLTLSPDFVTTSSMGQNTVILDNMFAWDSSLEYLDLSNIIIPSGRVYSCVQMFAGCSSLKHLNLSSIVFAYIQTIGNRWNGMLDSVPTDCEIIVSSAGDKSWFNTKFPTYTNVKTKAEYEAEQA